MDKFGFLAKTLILTWLLGVNLIAFAATPYQDYLQQSPELKRPEAGYQVGNFAKFAPNANELSRGFLSFALNLSFDQQRGPLLVTVDPSYSPNNGLGPFGEGFTLDMSVHRFRLQGSIQFNEQDLWQSPWGALALGSDGYYYPQGFLKKVRIKIDSNEVTAWLENRQTYHFTQLENVIDGTYAYHLTKVEDPQGRITLVEHQRAEGGTWLPKTVRYGGRKAEDLPYRIDFITEDLPENQQNIDFIRADTHILDKRIKEMAFTALAKARYSYVFQYQPQDFGVGFFLKSVQKKFANGQVDPAQIIEYQPVQQTDSGFQKYEGLDSLVSRYGFAFMRGERVSFYDYNRDGLTDIEVAEDHRVFVQTADGFSEAVNFPDNGSACFPKSGARYLARKVLPLLGYRSPLTVLITNRESSANDYSLMSCSLDGRVLGTISLPINLNPDQYLRWVDLNRDGRVDLVRLAGNRLRIFENRSTINQLDFVEVAPIVFAGNFRPESIWFADMNGDGITDFLAQGGQAYSVFLGYKDFSFLGESLLYDVKNTTGRAFPLSGYSLEMVDLNGDGLSDLSLTKGVDRFLFKNTGRQFEQLPIPSRAMLSNEGESFILPLGASAKTSVVKLNGSGSALALAVGQRFNGFMKSWNDGRGTLLEFEYKSLVGTPGQENPFSYLAALVKHSVALGTKRTDFHVEHPMLHNLSSMLLGFESVIMNDGLTRISLKFMHQDDFAGIVINEVREDLKVVGLLTKTVTSYVTDMSRDLPWPRLSEELQVQQRDAGSMQQVRKISNYDSNLCPQAQETVYQRETLIKNFDYWRPSNTDPYMSCLPKLVTLTGLHARMDLNFNHQLELSRRSNGDVDRVDMRNPKNPAERMFIQSIAYDDKDRPIVYQMMEGQKKILNYEGDSDLIQSTATGFGLKEAVTVRDPFDQISEYSVYQDPLQPWTYSFYRDGRERLEKIWDRGFGSPEEPLLSIRYADPELDKAGFIKFAQFQKQYKSTHDWLDVYSAAGDKIGQFEKYGSGFIVKGARRFFDAEKVVEAFPIQAASSDSYEALNWTKPMSREEGSGTFDQYQSVTAIDHNSNKSRQFDYSFDGLLRKTETTNGRYSKIWRLNSRGEVLEQTDEEKFTTRFDYDALGRLRDITLPDGKRHSVQLDVFGRNKRISRSEVGAIEIDYDARSLVSSKRYFDTQGALDRTCIHEYDEHGRKTLDRYSKAAEVDAVRYFYDGKTFNGVLIPGQTGKLTQVQGPNYVKTWSYDNKGRLTKSEQTVSTGTGRVLRTAEYSYDESDRITNQRLKIQDGSKLIDYQTQNLYDATGRQQKFLVNDQEVLIFDYNNLGLNKAISSPESILTMGFDEFTQSPEGFVFQNFGFGSSPATYELELDDRGFAASETYAQNGHSSSRIYEFSPRGFLRKASIAGVDYHYDYDANGLLKSIEDRNGLRSFRHEPMLSQDVNGQKLVLDAMSRTTERSGKTFGFGTRGVVTTVKSAAGTSEFMHDESGHILRTRDSNDAIHFGDDLYKGGRYLQPIKQGQQLVGWLDNGVFRPAASDFRGTPLFENDATLSLDPFGSGPQQGDFSATMHFAGHGRDDFSGLVRMGARQYDSESGMFLSPDPLFLEDVSKCAESVYECNLFSYAQNNPITLVDPTGMWSTEAHQQFINAVFSDPVAQEYVGKGSIQADGGEPNGIWGWIKFGVSQLFGSPAPHAMSRPFQSVESAKTSTKAYMGEQAAKAKEYLKAGNKEEYYKTIGLMLHPVMDNTSPEHKGYQTWNPLTAIFRGIGQLLGLNTLHHGDVGSSNEDLNDITDRDKETTSNDMKNTMKEYNLPMNFDERDKH